MPAASKVTLAVLRIITIVLLVLLASTLLFFGVANLVHPDVPDSALGQNTLVCLMFIAAGLFSIYAIFRPMSGGVVLCISGLVFFTAVIANPVAVPVILIGALSIARSKAASWRSPRGSHA